MALQDLYTLYGCSIAGSTISGIQDFAVDHGYTDFQETTDGDVYPRLLGIMEANPMVTCQSLCVASVIDAIPLTGTALGSGTPAPGVFYLQKAANKGTRTSGSNHVTGTINDGLAVLGQISAQTSQKAMATFVAHAIFDGTNDPIAYAGSQALAAGVAADEAFTVGPVSINGSTIGGVKSITIDPGLQIEKNRSDGDPFPTHVCIMTIRPSITIRVAHEIMVAYGIDGVQQGATDSIVYLRKLAQLGTRVADATAEHISFTIDDGLFTARTVRGSFPGTLEGEIRLTPNYDGSNAIIAIDTTAAIA